MSNQCEHGSLARSCEICERDEEIARLRERLEWATQFRVSNGLYIVKHGHNWVITGRNIASVPMKLHREFPAAAAAFRALEEYQRKGEG